MLKKAQVVILPTNEKPVKGQILRRHIWKGDPKLEEDSLWLYNNTITIDNVKQYTTLNGSFRDWYKAFIPQHLYIISDDEIKENDYCLNLETNTVFKMHKHGLPTSNRNKKIIATTDTSLINRRQMTFMDEATEWIYDLPQPSQQFIEKFIEEYNKGNVITNVLVEYEQDYANRNCSTCNLGTDGTCELNLEKKCCSSTNNVTKHGDYWISCLDGEEDSEIYKIKVNPKDTTITIKKLKDSWNR